MHSHDFYFMTIFNITIILTFHLYRFVLVLSLCLWLVPRLTDGLRVMITGSHGVLGQALIQHAIDTNRTTVPTITIFATYRSPDKCHQVIHHPSIVPLILDMNHETKHNHALSQFFVNHPEMVALDDSFVLFNNAGVCLPGNTLSALQTSLLVNCWGPALLSHALLRCPSTGNHRRTVINVSSGEGELLLLHSKIQEQLQSIDNYEDWQQYLVQLETSFDPNFEYAYGTTPMYSLSKALLNVYTRISHQERLNSYDRILSVCPGNFHSPMTTEEEKQHLFSSDMVASTLWKLAIDHDENFPSGFFYRNAQIIPW